MALLLILGLALSASAVVLTARAAVLPRLRASERLAAIEAYGFTGEAEAVTAPASRHTLEGTANLLGAVVVRRFPKFVPKNLERDLLRAGQYSLTPQTFIGYRALAGIGGILVGLWCAVTMPGIGLLLGITVGVIGCLLPVVMLRTRGDRRIAQVDYDLPELVDVLVVTVEAGLAFNSSLQLAAQRLRGPLAQELGLALQEQRMGLSTHQALTNLVERCDTPSMRSFVRSILQGASLGVSIGDIMRNLATETRTRRRQAAEERAQRAPIKMLFPLVFLILPAMFVVLLYPAISSVLETLGGV